MEGCCEKHQALLDRSSPCLLRACVEVMSLNQQSEVE
jgi:hypothetical protein